MAVNLEQEISDLKRKLSDSIAREQEIERELADCKIFCQDLKEACNRHYENLGEARRQLRQERAQADALAGALEETLPLSMRGFKGASRSPADIWDNAKAALKAYRNREKGNE